jgi:hypothetical protein
MLFAALAATAAGCRGEKPAPPPPPDRPVDPDALFPATGGPFSHRWGYIDTAGKIAIEPRFDHTRPFDGDYAFVQLGERMLVIDATGAVVLQPLYEVMLPHGLGEGRIPVRHEGKWGCIDVSGRLAIRAVYDSPVIFREGLARIERDRQFGYVDIDGSVIIPPRFSQAASFSEGLAAVQIGGEWVGRRVRGGRWGYVDRTGAMVIKPAFAWADAFSEGLAVTYAVAEGPVGAWTFSGYIDRSGRTAIAAGSYVRGTRFREGLAAVKTAASGKWAYIDANGGQVIPPTWRQAEPFSEGLAAVQPNDANSAGTWGYIDTRGELVVPAAFVEAEPFRNGLAQVRRKSDEPPIYIDRGGRPVWPPEVASGD